MHSTWIISLTLRPKLALKSGDASFGKNLLAHKRDKTRKVLQQGGVVGIATDGRFGTGEGLASMVGVDILNGVLLHWR